MCMLGLKRRQGNAQTCHSSRSPWLSGAQIWGFLFVVITPNT
ncbi:MAG: hypothetical protein ACI9SE_003752 [Neolewinella sp.]|jgi:hypothetical protein